MGRHVLGAAAICGLRGRIAGPGRRFGGRAVVGRAKSSFASACYWGSIDASGVISAYRRYLQANENDAKWAVTVADAFAAAGGEGAASSVRHAAAERGARCGGASAAGPRRRSIRPRRPALCRPAGMPNDPVKPPWAISSSRILISVSPGRRRTWRCRGCTTVGFGLDRNGVFGHGWRPVLDQLVLSDQGCSAGDGRWPGCGLPRRAPAGAGRRRDHWLTREPPRRLTSWSPAPC